MTPALMWAMLDKKRQDYRREELPIAQLTSFVYNMNRSMGDKDRNIPAAPFLPMAKFCLFSGDRDKTLAANTPNPGGDHILEGAVTDRAAWEGLSKTRKSIYRTIVDKVRRIRR